MQHVEQGQIKTEIRRAIEVIGGPAWERGDVVELRALGTERGTQSGYFDTDHRDELIEAAMRLSGDAAGVYLTLNPVTRDCLARAANRTVPYAKHATGVAEITRLHWLLIDTDPERPSGISATDQEHDAALQRACDIRDALVGQGWPSPIYSDSGNGGHLLYRIDLPIEDASLIKSVLKELHRKFGDKVVAIDTTVFNASRISKLYGTLACKGDSLRERPHRLARTLEVPAAIEFVPRKLLESIATQSSRSASAFAAKRIIDPDAKEFDVVAYFESHGITLGKEKDWGDGKLWELERCPWRIEEPDGGPFVMQKSDGTIVVKCKHRKCEGNGWDELRDLLEPGWRDMKTGKKGPSIAQQLVALGSDDELFHTADNHAYVTINRDKRRETWPVNGESYRLILRGRMHQKGVVANRSAIDDAVATLEAKAIFDGRQHEVHLRTAAFNGRLYIDLCNDAWEAVEVSNDGWQVVANPPVKFVRTNGMLPLPAPASGGDIAELRQFINATEQDWALVVAWLLAALRPTGPYPILLVNGEQGSCKSTACRLLRMLIDPNTVPLRNAPKDERTLMIWGKNSHVIALDNLSQVPRDLSNAMCRLATGGGHSDRKNYSDDAETLIYAVRPQMLNGIGDIATRSDFLDRALSIHLPVLPKSARKSEKELEAQFAASQATIFGALLTAVSSGLRRLPEIERMKLDLPRLADFAQWILAAEAGLGWERGTFLRVLDRNADDSHELAISSCVATEAMRRYIAEKGQYDGGWEELLRKLNTFIGDRRPEGWPKNATWLSTLIRERAPNLRGVGIEVEFHDNARPKRLTLRAARPASGDAIVDSRYISVAQVPCYGNDRTPAALATRLLDEMTRCWLAPPVASVAMPSLWTENGDGLQVLTALKVAT